MVYQQKIGYDENREFKYAMEWCSREEATHVSGSGVSGVIARIEDITVVGTVNWNEEAIDKLRASADLLSPARIPARELEIKSSR